MDFILTYLPISPNQLGDCFVCAFEDVLIRFNELLYHTILKSMTETSPIGDNRLGDSTNLVMWCREFDR